MLCYHYYLKIIIINILQINLHFLLGPASVRYRFLNFSLINLHSSSKIYLYIILKQKQLNIQILSNSFFMLCIGGTKITEFIKYPLTTKTKLYTSI